MTPFLKWAGGKTQIIDRIKDRVPESYNRYFEPFVGSASVLFNLSPDTAFINDINGQLINVYNQIKSSPENVIEYIERLDSVPCEKDFYYEIREKYNGKINAGQLDCECATMMIWLNKHCFNGLYRVNSKGLFNVPYNNRKSGKSADSRNIRMISDYLKNAEINITCTDFEEACKDVKENDFVYFDSPYIPESSTANFTDYTSDGFTENDHRRLASLFRNLDKKGAKLMLSNNDVKEIYSLYDGYNIQQIPVKRMINSDADNRKGREVLITNY